MEVERFESLSVSATMPNSVTLRRRRVRMSGP